MQSEQTHICTKWHFWAVLCTFSHQDTPRTWTCLLAYWGKRTRLLATRASGQASGQHQPHLRMGGPTPNGNLCSIGLTLSLREAKNFRVQRCNTLCSWTFHFTSPLQIEISMFLSFPVSEAKVSIEGGGGCQCALVENKKDRDFPGSPVSKTPCSQCRGPRFDPWSGK